MPRQSKLFEKETKVKNTFYACHACLVHPIEDKYKTVIRGKHARILLEHIVGNLWKCPKCRTMYYDCDFGKFTSTGKKTCRKCGSQRLKYDPFMRELVCMDCGLVS